MLFNTLKRHKTIFLIILTVLAIKIALFFWAVYNFDFVAHPQNNWLSIWDRWDAGIYKTIARSSYSFAALEPKFWFFLSHFPPLYPLLMAMISGLFNISLLKAGVLISLASVIAASTLLYKLTFLEFKNGKVAWFSVLLFNLYPTSYFTISVYSESLFLLLAIAAFYYLKKSYYPASGLAAAGAILTRLAGIVFLPVYALLAFYNYRKYKFNLKTIFLPLLPFLGLITYLTINKLYFGSYFYFLTEKLSFFNTTKHLILPFKETLLDLLETFKKSNLWDRNFMMARGWNAIFTSFTLLIIILGIKRLNWTYSVYSLGSIFIFASLSWGISNARYTLAIFPVFMILAQIKSKPLLLGILLTFAAGLLYFTKIFTSGIWAF